MEINEYQKLAMVTLNKELGKKEILTNSVMGLCGESGEACDIVKKHLCLGKKSFVLSAEPILQTEWQSKGR